jgi:hypothetical protein
MGVGCPGVTVLDTSAPFCRTGARWRYPMNRLNLREPIGGVLTGRGVS